MMRRNRTVHGVWISLAVLALMPFTNSAVSIDRIRQRHALGHQHPRLTHTIHGRLDGSAKPADAFEQAVDLHRIRELEAMLEQRDRRIRRLESANAKLRSRNAQLTRELDQARMGAGRQTGESRERQEELDVRMDRILIAPPIGF